MTALPLTFPSLHLGGVANYQTLPALRASMLKAARVSLRHLRHQLDNPIVATAAMREGSAFDRWLLDGEPIAWEPVVNRRTNAGKAELAEFAEANAGRPIVRSELRPAFDAMRDNVMAHPLAAQLVEQSHKHAVALWRDDASGAPCKLEADMLLDPCGVFPVEADLKRTSFITPHAIRNQAWKMGWFHQRAWYRWGLIENDVELAAQFIVAVSPDPPHECVVYEIEPATLDALDVEIAALVKAIVAAEKSGDWPGIDRGRTALMLGAPRWALNDAEESATTDDDETETET